jgi:hypothetical protein
MRRLKQAQGLVFVILPFRGTGAADCIGLSRTTGGTAAFSPPSTGAGETHQLQPPILPEFLLR